MFRSLRTKLTVLYAGLFCLALLLIGATAYAVVVANAQRLVREQLQATGAVFDRLWELRVRQMQDGARLSAADYGFREAIASRDEATIHSALANLKRRLGADLVFLITTEGVLIGEDGVGSASAAPSLQIALEQDDAPVGVLLSGGVLHQAVTSPILAPDLLGWVVVGERLDQEEMRALERFSAIPLQAAALAQSIGGDWSDGDDHDRQALRNFIARALDSEGAGPSVLDASSGRAIASVKPLHSLDGVRSVLLLRYPLASALSPYRPLLNSLIAIGVLGVSMLSFGSWLLARGITRPLSRLEEAARKLREGIYEPVAEPRSKDELSRLAAGFNAMIAAIREREKRITHLAYHDAETRLPNRLALERRLAATQSQRLYLAAIGVDRFSHVRGAIGYRLAGALMRKLGARLARFAPNAPMARLSSDVLSVAFLANSETDARMRAQALASNLEQPLSLDGQVVDMTVTIGIAQPRTREESTAAMIERASVALDQARSARLKAAAFDEAAYGNPARNLSLMGEMLHALESGAMRLAHQPKYDFRQRRIDSAETLVRWRHPTRGMIAPDLFVPMAEETGHVRALTEWVLRRTVREQRLLCEAGRPLALSVNISGRLLGDADFAESALAIVRGAPHQICFEITETAIIDNPKTALENIELFAANGVQIAIDDYGSGLSSLGYLKQLPAHELKIDKVFIESVSTSQRDALLVRSTIDLGHGLGLKVTAEGVENPAVFELLAAMGCDMAQGFLVARPSSINELLTILNDSRRMQFYERTAKISAVQ
jgi:EAL domain-containing protein (putative c-di-GMP-specific phosphodiesterase class I)/GGDEF domain-containing protein